MKNSSPGDITEIVSQIRKFIDSQKDPNLVTGIVKKKSHQENLIEIGLSKKVYLNKGSSVVVNDFQGLVLDSDYKKILIEIDSADYFFVNEEVELDLNPFSVILARLEKTILKIENEDLNKRNKEILNFLLGMENPTYVNSKNNFFSENLNYSQSMAVNRAINSNDFHLIIGPPGTGKTYVIKEIILQMAKLNQKVLLTAWTNIAVDNILGRINEISEDKILRIGSKKDISPKNMKYTLFERRKEHSDWRELKDIKGEISHHKKELNKLFDSLTSINNEINKLNQQKNQLNVVSRNIKCNISDFNLLMKNINVNNVEKDPELIKVEKNIDNHDLKAGKYEEIVDMFSRLQDIQKSLPQNDEFYLLESELKKLKGKGLVKKVTSIFNKSGFEDYKSDLYQKEYDYQVMVKKFNSYWDFKDQFDEKFSIMYPQEPGNPDEDALENYIASIEKLEVLIPLKKEYLKKNLEKEANEILRESYKIYIDSLEKKYYLLVGEHANLNARISLKNKEKKIVSNLIDNTKITISNLKNNERLITQKIDHDIFKKASLIFSTVISAASPLMKEYSFDVMIMDESSQVASYMSLIPLLKCNKFILVGDNKQLQPIIESNLDAEHNKSIFNNLMEKYPDSCTFLDTQYRMNGYISNLASELFYDKKLKTHPPISNQLIDCNLRENINPILNPLSPITFLDTSEINFYEDGVGQGCKNTKEALIVKNMISFLIKSGISEEEIGVISPYAKQKEKIRELIDYKVEVDTVYSFQGREKDIIIMSFCKSKLGKLNHFVKKFIEQPTQINVAITRARKKLILVGNIKLLKGSKLLNQLIENIDDDYIIQCNENHLNDLGIKLESLDKEISEKIK